MADHRERTQLLVEWNATQSDYPRDRCVHQLFEDQVARTPHAVAVVCGERQLTYGELNRRANQVACGLRARGAASDRLVGICLARCPEMIVGLLGILKAGAAFLPLDPQDPPERARFLVRDAQIQLVLATREVQARWREQGIHTAVDQLLALDAEPDVFQGMSDQNPEHAADPEQLAYVMYTSGSTGQPKGVAVCHRAIVRLLFGVDYVQLDNRQSILQLAPLSFDASTFEIWGALLHGGRLVLAPPGPPDFAILQQLLQRHGVNTLWLTASLFNSLIETCPQALAGVQQLLTGGEALSVRHVRLAQEQLGPHTTLINGYGPTEATTFSCCYRIPRPLDPALTTIPIGRPIANTQVYVLDEGRQLAPIGSAGELYIGGDGLARGYWNRPELTAERFVPHPFQPGQRLYRTGDQGRWRADGTLEFLGRLDHQVKLRGYRIELGEIETVLGTHPDVAQAVVRLWETVPGDQRLVAYWVAAAGGSSDASALREHLRRRLPNYMLPAVFVRLDAWPLTPSGKIDRQALPAPDAAALTTAPGETYVAPRNPVEETLAAIWGKVLGLPRVGIHDDFFELGGHSLLAIQVMVRVGRMFGVELRLRLLFEYPTIAALAEQVVASRSQADRDDDSDSGRPIPRLARANSASIPLSFAQRRLWFLEQLEGQLTAYNIPGAWQLTGPLDAEALRRALETVVQRHEPLRTVFCMPEGEPCQVVLPPPTFALPIEDLSGLPRADRATQVSQRAIAEAEQPFDLTGDLSLRARLLRFADQDHVLLLTQHHIASDGWSQHLLWRELQTVYQATLRGESPALEELACQYADYAVWQQARLQGPRLQEQLAYWRRQLAGLRPLELPIDHPRPAQSPYRGARVPFTCDGKRLRGLHQLSRAAGTTLQMTLLAAFQVLLHRSSGQHDLAVGVPIAGRLRPELEPLIGFFVNTLVIRSHFTESLTFRQVLAQVRDNSLEAYDHQELPFEQLVEALQPERHLSRNPLVQVLFQLLRLPAQQDWGDLHLEPLPDAAPRIHVDLEVNLQDLGDRLDGEIVYRTDL